MRYAIGDIHGCFNELKTLLEVKLQVGTEDEIYLVGDLITKGADSLKVIEYIQVMNEKGFNVSSVMGNHEWRVLNLYYSDFNLFENYLEAYNCLDLLDGELDEIISFMASLPYYIDTGEWLIVHSELGDTEEYDQRDARFIFGKDKFEEVYSSGIINQRMQVHGHRVRALNDIYYDCMVTSSSIGIDGGCVYPDYGYLCALNLDEILIADVVQRES